jgi:radical SAM superfamily enzyme YgiQ (UPF0313 family)
MRTAARNNMTNIFLCDFVYFNQYTDSRLNIPLNIGYIASYVTSLYGANCNITLFKNPVEFLEVIKEQRPDIVGLSCYMWNLDLDIAIAKEIKKINPQCLVILGGWNVDINTENQKILYEQFQQCVDYLVVDEGERGFGNIVGKFLSVERTQLFEEPIDGCTFFREDGKNVRGKDIGLTIPLDDIFSPILSGLLDKFFYPQSTPLLQTSRLCPYQCTFCVSGIRRGKLRTFPLDTVEAEIGYIADKYVDAPHAYLFITDENFGILKRDAEIAEFLAKSKRDKGFPQQVFYYTNKKFTETVKKVTLALGDINSMGVTLPFQSMNQDTIKSVERINLTKSEIKIIIDWAGANNFPVFTELIFGLPNETKASFLEGVEYLVASNIDMVLIHHAILLMGSKLYWQSERDKYKLITKYRPTSDADYGYVNGNFVCEVEEVVVSSSHFSFEDYKDIRKFSFLFWAVFNIGYCRSVLKYLIRNGIKVVPVFDKLINDALSKGCITEQTEFFENLTDDANSELFDSPEELKEHMQEAYNQNGRKIAEPSRLNPKYTTRLIYKEKWFSRALEDTLFSNETLNGCNRRVLKDLLHLSAMEWVDLTDLELRPSLTVNEATVDYLGLSKPEVGAENYIIRLSSSDRQKNILDSFIKEYGQVDESFHYSALTSIQPRKTLQYEHMEVELV